jgi:hypothetical protein
MYEPRPNPNGSGSRLHRSTQAALGFLTCDRSEPGNRCRSAGNAILFTTGSLIIARSFAQVARSVPDTKNRDEQRGPAGTTLREGLAAPSNQPQLDNLMKRL